MSQPQQKAKEQEIYIQLQDARLAVDISLRELSKAVDQRDALKAALAAIHGRESTIDLTTDSKVDRFIVPWGFCEDDDAV